MGAESQEIRNTSPNADLWTQSKSSKSLVQSSNGSNFLPAQVSNKHIICRWAGCTFQRADFSPDSLPPLATPLGVTWGPSCNEKHRALTETEARLPGIDRALALAGFLYEGFLRIANRNLWPRWWGSSEGFVEIICLHHLPVCQSCARLEQSRDVGG